MPLADEAWRVFVRKEGMDDEDNPLHPMVGYLAGFATKFQAEEAVLKMLADDDFLVISSDRLEPDIIRSKNLQAEQVVLD